MDRLLRTFNAFTGLSIRYKPFHNQLRKAAFPEFMRRLLERTLEKMTRPVLSAGLGSKLGRFRDILLHDGSSFALKDGLKKEWPGRFTKVSPAAVELHVTMSAFEDNPIQITLAPDKERARRWVLHRSWKQGDQADRRCPSSTLAPDAVCDRAVHIP